MHLQRLILTILVPINLHSKLFLLFLAKSYQSGKKNLFNLFFSYESGIF
jgi:hypothetical protein